MKKRFVATGRSISAMSNVSAKSAPNRGSKPYRKFHYILKEYDKFGADTPKWTISARINKEPPNNNYPGPGDYDIPEKVFERTNLPHLISSRTEAEEVPITLDLDYKVDTNIMPDVPIKIGEKNGQSYISNTFSPDRTFVPPPFGSDTCTKISNKYKYNDDNGIPGPGAYNPIDNVGHIPTYSMSIHDEADKKKRHGREQLPGPGSYNLTEPLPPVGNWTEKLRHKPPKRRNQPVNRLCPWEKPKLVLNV